VLIQFEIIKRQLIHLPRRVTTSLLFSVSVMQNFDISSSLSLLSLLLELLTATPIAAKIYTLNFKILIY